MTDFMQNIYVYLWGALALLMFAVAVKNIKSKQTRQTGTGALIMGFFFVFLTIWYGLRTFGGYAMFSGVLGIIFRVILGIMLAAMVLAYFIMKKKRKGSDSADKDE